MLTHPYKYTVYSNWRMTERNRKEKGRAGDRRKTNFEQNP
jgi:hypothetical protein